MGSISLKLDRGLAKEIDSFMRSAHYSTKTEFIREAIRDKLAELREEQAKEKAWEKLFAMRGILKDKAISDKEFYKMREDFSKELEKELKAKYKVK